MSETATLRWGLGRGPQLMLINAETGPFDVAAGRSSWPESDKTAIFRSLFDDYWITVRHHLGCYLDNQEEVDELTAEVFVIAWRKLRPETPMGLRWFIRTADNKLRERDRRALSRGRAMEALNRSLVNAQEELHPLEVLALRQAMKTLNARERQVVILTYWDGLSASEIAEVLRSSESAVWTTLTRARNKLRAQLGRAGGDA